MIRKLMVLIGSAALSLASAFASAQDWYGALHVGKGWKSPADMTGNINTTIRLAIGESSITGDYNGELDYDSGYGLGGALGRSFGNWRLEVEFGYRRAKIGGFNVHPDDIRVTPRPPQIEGLLSGDDPDIGAIDVTGRAKLFASAMNLYYDIPVSWSFRPYVGAGVGAVRADKRKVVDVSTPLSLTPPHLAERCRAQAPPQNPCPRQSSGSDTEWAFNWQVMGGLKYAFNERWDAALGWRYTDLDGVGFQFTSDEAGERFLSGDPLMVSKNGLHSVELTLIRWF